MQVSVYRYNPDLDEVPVMRDVSVDLPEGKDLMVLDVLQLIKDEDPTLSFRRSCREGVCGSDGINMNGKNGLACITPVSEVVKRNKLVLRPLPGLPVVRDLVVDMSQFYKQYSRSSLIWSITKRHRPKSVCSLQRTAKKSTACMSVSYVPVVLPLARHSGGIRINSLALLDCCRPTVFWRTLVTPTPSSAWPI